MKQKKNIEIAIFVFLIFIGCVRAFANVADMDKTSAFFAALNISPAMKVFTAHNGYETFSPKFELEFISRNESKIIELTPALYQQLSGPYNRRNVYGAAISYGPVLVSNDKTHALFHSVASYSFCEPASLLNELNLDVQQPIDKVVIHYIHSETSGSEHYPSTLEVNCG